tara:strand:- start:3728 stop:4816 length:1089 start_codon:yes stop_codon:yes gene_type:complete
MGKNNLKENELQSGQIGLALVDSMQEITLSKIGDEGINNAHKNLKFLEKGLSLKELRNAPLGEGDQAVIIAAGPSLHKTNVAQNLKSSEYKGAIIVPDSAMLYCLKNDIIPDLVVTLDPHPKRIVRWFGDPDLVRADLESDDYFSRQDMDPAFADQMRVNDEVIELLEKYGKKIKIALSTSASDAVVQRAINTGMEIYWWNPMYDDPDLPDSETLKLHKLNGLPCLNAGGNVGSACWMIADAVLDKQHVALTGMDFSYYADTPYKNTQYYYELLEMVPEEQLDTVFMRIFNPYLKKWFYTDPAYMWYRKTFLEMAADASCVTYNCTGGGILFGENIIFTSLDGFLNESALVLTTSNDFSVSK